MCHCRVVGVVTSSSPVLLFSEEAAANHNFLHVCTVERHDEVKNSESSNTKSRGILDQRTRGLIPPHIYNILKFLSGITAIFFSFLKEELPQNQAFLDGGSKTC